MSLSHDITNVLLSGKGNRVQYSILVHFILRFTVPTHFSSENETVCLPSMLFLYLLTELSRKRGKGAEIRTTIN